MLGRMKFSTAVYLITLILLVGWLIKSYLDFTQVNGQIKKVSSLANNLTQQVIANPAINEQLEKIKEKYRRLSDGIFVADNNQTKNYPIAIIIENFPEARPVAGIDQASVVYEAPAEGGISRFLAIFDSLDNIERIGPIRSVRPYFLDWAEEFGRPVFLHVGGSPEALATIKKRQIINLDEFFWRDDYYKRVTDRKRPHNTYTTKDLLEKIKTDYQLDVATYEPWKFKEDAPLDERGTFGNPQLNLSFLPQVNNKNEKEIISWNYDREKNEYQRWQGREVATTENGSVIKAKNLILLSTDAKVLDDIGRLKIKTLGEGQAKIFQDGQIIDGLWKKDKTTSRLKFYKATGVDEITFNAGPTWIEVSVN